MSMPHTGCQNAETPIPCPPQCFRLYTKQFFDRQMPDVTAPEIQRTSLVRRRDMHGTPL